MFGQSIAHADNTTEQVALSPALGNSTATTSLADALASAVSTVDTATVTVSTAASSAESAVKEIVNTPAKLSAVQNSQEVQSAITASTTAVGLAVSAIQDADTATVVAATAIQAVGAQTAVVATDTTNVANTQAAAESSLVTSTTSGVTATVYTYNGGGSPALPAPTDTPIITKTVPYIYQYFGSGSVEGGPADHVIVKYEGTITAPSNATAVKYAVYSDDGAKLYIDGQLVINNWRDQGPRWSAYSPTYDVTTDKSQDFILWYYENGGGANVVLGWGITLADGSGYFTSPMAESFGTTTTTKDPVLVAAADTAKSTLTVDSATLVQLTDVATAAVSTAVSLANTASAKADEAKAILDTAVGVVTTTVNAAEAKRLADEKAAAEAAAAAEAQRLADEKAAADKAAADKAAAEAKAAAEKAAADAAAAKAKAEADAAKAEADRIAAEKAAAEKAAKDAALAEQKRKDEAAAAAQQAANEKAAAEARAAEEARVAAEQAAKEAEAAKAKAEEDARIQAEKDAQAAADAAKAQEDAAKAEAEAKAKAEADAALEAQKKADEEQRAKDEAARLAQEEANAKAAADAAAAQALADSQKPTPPIEPSPSPTPSVPEPPAPGPTPPPPPPVIVVTKDTTAETWKPAIAPETYMKPAEIQALKDIGIVPNNAAQLPTDKPKPAPAEVLVPHVQVDVKGVENGGIQFFGTQTSPQVVTEDGTLTPPAPPPGSGLEIPADAITLTDTFIGQPGGTSFNAPDVAVPVIETPVEGALAVVPGVQAINHAFVAMANIGNDMSPVTRKKAKKILVATIVGGAIIRFRRRFG